MKQYLVFTTINVPHIIKDYIKNFSDYGHGPSEAGIIIIGDLKTPPETSQFIDGMEKSGFAVDYFDVKKQEEWLEKFPDFKKIVPYNSDNRRNIGYLIAAEKGAEVIIAVDDDNYPKNSEDFLKEHSIVGQVKELDVLSDESSWFNICSAIKFDPERKIYPRGYPYSKRFKDGKILHSKKKGRIVLNEGLWFEDPDIDSVTRLTEDVKGKEIKEERIFLDKGTFSPINSQNTAFHRDILPCAYFVLMGGDINGLTIERYGDIWFGFFAKKIIDHMGDYAGFGKPFAIHRRNQHNLLKDLKQEFWAIIFTELLAEFIEKAELSEKTYSGCYLELAEKLEKFVLENKNFNEEAKNYFLKVVSAMKVWAHTCDKILKNDR